MQGGRGAQGTDAPGRPRARAVLAGGVLVALVLATASAAGAQESAPAPAPAPVTATIPMVAVEAQPDGTLDIDRYEVASDAEAAALQSNLLTEPDTVSVSVDTPVTSLGTNDPMRPQQWALDKTSFESAWSKSRGGGVKVAIVDSGVRGDHEDLAGAVVAGKDYVNDGGDGRIDPAGHGTHVAGIIAAVTGNGRGVASGAPGARIMPVRVLDANGVGVSSDVAEGIIWAADHGARVVNLSLGAPTPMPSVRDAIQYAVSKKVVVVAAGGNGALSGNIPLYPAADPEPIAVGALTSSLTRASFSNYGSYIDFAAPGDGILSTYSTSTTSYAHASGTSMASPFVAAAAAIVISVHPDSSVAQVRKALESTARDLGPAGKDAEYGAGLVDPAKAVWIDPDRGTEGTGYWIVTADGRVRAYGAAKGYGDAYGRTATPIVASARTSSGRGYWLVSSNGTVYAYGDAKYHGGVGGRRLAAGIVGIAPTPTGKGYWLLGADGGIFSFGDARFYGSTGNLRLRAPIIDMAVTPKGRGYWLVALDGGIFSFGDARFYGSTGNLSLVAPVTSMAASSARGYWLIARDGGVFTFSAEYHGSLPALGQSSASTNAVRIRALEDGSGYYIATASGAVYTFGTTRYFGAPGPLPWMTPVVDMMVLD